ncbi:MAG TPA: hypothetical protein VFA77_07075 [Candidatus Eisenbacteria bacterium]|nr:hypothetical protein [Candidatus Eisenbacteria bacterium]
MHLGFFIESHPANRSPFAGGQPELFLVLLEKNAAVTRVGRFKPQQAVTGHDPRITPADGDLDGQELIGVTRVNQLDFHQGWLGVAGYGTYVGMRNFTGHYH